MNDVPLKAPFPVPAALKRLGIGGFVFFLTKGLLWLAVPWVAHLLAS